MLRSAIATSTARARPTAPSETASAESDAAWARATSALTSPVSVAAAVRVACSAWFPCAVAASSCRRKSKMLSAPWPTASRASRPFSEVGRLGKRLQPCDRLGGPRAARGVAIAQGCEMLGLRRDGPLRKKPDQEVRFGTKGGEAEEGTGVAPGELPDVCRHHARAAAVAGILQADDELEARIVDKRNDLVGDGLMRLE